MKKFILPLSFLLIGAFIFYACKKENIEAPASNGCSVSDGRLVFNSIEEYEGFLNDSDSSSDNSNFRFASGPQWKRSSDTLIEDEFLASILNEKNIIQIGNNAYKLDFKEHQVYVLREINNTNMGFLERKDVSSGKLIVYSMDDDVLTEEEEIAQASIEEGIALKKKKAKCKEGGARRCKDKVTLDTQDEISVSANADGSITIKTLVASFTGKLVYQKAGIYFSIQSKLTWSAYESSTTYNADGTTSSSIKIRRNQKFHGSATADGKYKIKCKDEHTVSASLPPNCYDKMKLDDETTKSGRIYRGSKALNKYCINANYKYNTEDCSVSTNAEMILKIGDGYPDCDVCPNKD